LARDLLKPTRWMRLRHAVHLWWNKSRFNSGYDPFISDCLCCCSRCEEIYE